MFDKILIANRGEIACRVAATARRLAIKTVAVYSDADANAKHVSVCDESVYIGGSAPSESYLRWENIIAAAKATGAQAVHPGYGFLSENVEFAQACADAGLVFIGPLPSSIKAMGLKAESKRLMHLAGVPLVPGYHGADQDPALLQREADNIGYPVLIKASAGGGGKGMRAVNYVGAGTVEFIVEQRQNGAMTFFFMEMNTRLQVEHPVTEAITGQDLVEWQLRVASGEALPLRQDQLKITGHAIEARICAENPDNNFLPATGALHVYGLPDCVTFERNSGGVRVDSGVREGDVISPFYDSMVAKLIVHGDTREQALSRLDAALAHTHIVGLSTNVQFLRNVVQSRSFAQADLDTGLIPREEAVLFKQEKVGLNLAVAGAIAHTLQQEKTAEAQLASQAQWQDPWARQDGWRSHGPSSRRFDFEFAGAVHVVQLSTAHDGGLQLNVAGELGAFSFTPVIQGLDVRFGAQRQIVSVYRNGPVAHVFSAQGATQIIAIDALAHAGDTQSEGGRLTAPMPGKVVSFAVKAGDKVTKGQALAVMDAMKMEHTIAAPMDGVVAELLYAPGDQVTEGVELLKLVS